MLNLCTYLAFFSVKRFWMFKKVLLIRIGFHIFSLFVNLMSLKICTEKKGKRLQKTANCYDISCCIKIKIALKVIHKNLSSTKRQFSCIFHFCTKSQENVCICMRMPLQKIFQMSLMNSQLQDKAWIWIPGSLNILVTSFLGFSSI